MEPIPVPTGSPLCTTFTIHEATAAPIRDGIVVIHHGICHTRAHFADLIRELTGRGFTVAMIDQQSEKAGKYRNRIGPGGYRRGMAAAVRTIKVHTHKDIGCYVLHSMGAMVGEEMQNQGFNQDLRAPTVLMAPIPVHGALPVTVKLFLYDPLAYLKALWNVDIHALAETEDQVRRLFFTRDTQPDIVALAAKELKHASFWMYIRLILRPLIPWRWIRNDGKPKLLLYSTSDWLFHHKLGFLLTKWLYRPQLQVAQIPGGHDFFIEHASETADQVRRFYEQHHVEKKVETENPVVPSPHFGLAAEETQSPKPQTLPEARE